MKTSRFFFILLILASTLCIADDAVEVYEKYSPNVVYVESLSGLGTGFFLTPNTVITNRHVVFGSNANYTTPKPLKKISYTESDKTKKIKEITEYKNVFCSKRVDICIIQLFEKQENIKNLDSPLENKPLTIKVGQNVYVIGHPEGIFAKIISTGLVSSELSLLDWHDFKGEVVQILAFVTNAPISPGSSGSPVFSSKGELLGIAVGGYKDDKLLAQNLNYIISYLEIKNLIQQIADTKFDDFFIFPTTTLTETASTDKIPSFPKTTDTAKLARVATNIGNLIEAEKKKINSLKEVDNRPSEATVMIDDVPVEKIAVSTIDPNAVRKLLREHVPQFRYCYQKELDVYKNPDSLKGILNIKFFIGAEGRVSSSEITSDEINSDKVLSCIKNVLNGIQFPIPIAGKSVEINQPLNLFQRKH